MPLITFLILAYFFPDTADRPGKEDCPTITVTYTIEKVTSEKSKIVVTAQGGKEPYRYFFFNKTGGVLDWELENNSYIGSAKSWPAKITVSDAAGCMKTIELKESAK